MVQARGGYPDPRRSRSIGFIRRVIPTVDAYHGQRFLVRRAGRFTATPLLMVLVLVEISDLIFAVDSVPAFFAVTSEPFLVFSSNAFAILGLRALYFLLAGLMDRFTYLKLGLAAVLGFVGLKMLLTDIIHIPLLIFIGAIAACPAITAGASLHVSRKGATPGKTQEQAQARVTAHDCRRAHT